MQGTEKEKVGDQERCEKLLWKLQFMTLAAKHMEQMRGTLHGSGVKGFISISIVYFITYL